MAHAPLNPGLYRRLQKLFGTVAISNEGLETKFRRRLVRLRAQELPIEMVQAGEYYAVNCCFCDDTRHRLYVNYRYGQKFDGIPLYWLAVCYNEEACMNDAINRDRLRQMLNDSRQDLANLPVKPGRTLKPEELVADWPGPCVRLDQLPASHVARRYVQSRRFDPDRLGRFYQLSYCQDSFWPLARHRLVVPMYADGVMRGWQARYVGELNWKKKDEYVPPKYFTLPGMHKALFVANLDVARNYHTGVLVEGWFDVFGFGPMACPLLGSTMSAVQRRQFAAAFGARAGVCLLDPEVFDDPKVGPKARELIADLRTRFSGNFAAVKLPAGTDPGSLDRDFLRDYVTHKARKKGVKVNFARWE